MKIVCTIIVLFLFFLFIFKRKRIETSIVLNQPIDLVWKLFKSTSSYPEWNTLFSLNGFPTHVGQRVTVDLYDENKHVQFQMQPEVKALDKYRLEWEGRFYINGLFNGRHQFIFIKIDDDTTQFIQAEDFNGMLVPILNYFVIKPAELNFERMNQSFKKYAESHKSDKDTYKISKTKS